MGFGRGVCMCVSGIKRKSYGVNTCVTLESCVCANHLQRICAFNTEEGTEE